VLWGGAGFRGRQGLRDAISMDDPDLHLESP
jgi:hypothetical protein